MAAGLWACRFCRFGEELILFVVWYIIYGVTVGKEKQVQEWNIYQLDRQPINGASQLEEYKCCALKIGSYWAILADAEKPDDRSVKSGKYIKKNNSDENIG